MLHDTTYQDLSRETTLDHAAVLVMDEESFRSFYDRTARGLWAYLARVTGDRALADDLLQEAFYRFLRAGTAYETESHRRNSLYRIATNLAVDARRRSHVRGEANVGGDAMEALPGAATAAAAERGMDLTRALQHMKPRERAMLWMAYAEGASHREIAETLGLETSSLKPLLFRARKKLAALLGRGKA